MRDLQSMSSVTKDPLVRFLAILFVACVFAFLVMEACDSSAASRTQRDYRTSVASNSYIE